jgi:hypothetical protein
VNKDSYNSKKKEVMTKFHNRALTITNEQDKTSSNFFIDTQAMGFNKGNLKHRGGGLKNNNCHEPSSTIEMY